MTDFHKLLPIKVVKMIGARLQNELQWNNYDGMLVSHSQKRRKVD